jgi:hypothetical protein
MEQQHGGDPGSVTAERRQPADPNYAASVRPQPMRDGPPELIVRENAGADAEKRSSGVRDVIGGCVLIGIGFMWGSSVFLGNPTALDWFFDGLGTFWLCKGLFNILTA